MLHSQLISSNDRHSPGTLELYVRDSRRLFKSRQLRLSWHHLFNSCNRGALTNSCYIVHKLISISFRTCEFLHLSCVIIYHIIHHVECLSEFLLYLFIRKVNISPSLVTMVRSFFLLATGDWLLIMIAFCTLVPVPPHCCD